MALTMRLKAKSIQTLCTLGREMAVSSAMERVLQWVRPLGFV